MPAPLSNRGENNCPHLLLIEIADHKKLVFPTYETDDYNTR